LLELLCWLCCHCCVGGLSELLSSFELQFCFSSSCISVFVLFELLISGNCCVCSVVVFVRVVGFCLSCCVGGVVIVVQLVCQSCWVRVSCCFVSIVVLFQLFVCLSCW
jgi:hypothetical protein